MNSEQPPPYGAHPPAPPGGPSAPIFPPGFSSQPAAYPAPPYQGFHAQPYTGGDPSYPPYYQGPPGPPGTYTTQPVYQGYQSGPQATPYPWDGSKGGHMLPKNTVYMVEEGSREHSRGGRGLLGGVGGLEACLAACSAALCCCCLWDCCT